MHPLATQALTSLFLVSAVTAAAVEGIQKIELEVGWNSIWLEVEPTYAEGDLASGEVLAAGDSRIGLAKAPEDVFSAHTNVKTVATPKVLTGIAEIFDGGSPTTSIFNQEGWRQWMEGAIGGNDLVRMAGNRPYLIFVETARIDLDLPGEVEFFRHTWVPDRYNLVGFGIDPDNLPSFGEFFSPSGGKHPVDLPGKKIHRLRSDGDWIEVDSTDTMAAGEAYWVFCSGNSDYVGPVAIDFDGAATGRLNFAGPGDSVAVDPLNLDLEEIVFTNLTAAETVPELELISGSAALELHVVNPAPATLDYVLGNQVDSAPGDGNAPGLEESVASTTTATLTLGAQRNWTSGAVGRTNLYRLRTGAGSEFWLPVSAAQSDLQLPTDTMPESDAGRAAGLWVGDVVIDSVTSIVENDPQVRPASTKAPLRILLHSDASGDVQLLSQVTLMQTKTADDSVPPVPVLVLDQARIPFFEGIKERHGKRVGIRIESVAFDMPRKLDPGDQTALVAAFPAEDLSDRSDVAEFLNTRTLRPPSLSESYELSWALEGALGAGKTLRTASVAPLNLDPFHRSNPFRHAFHQKHPRGPNITRDIEIVFDAAQSVGEQLAGSYRETVTGLTSDPLVSSGRIRLHRLSPINELQP